MEVKGRKKKERRDEDEIGEAYGGEEWKEKGERWIPSR